jgi:hypothetical protein
MYFNFWNIFLEYYNYGGVQTASTLNGLSSLINQLQINIPSSARKLGTPVSTIDYSDANGQVIVTTANNTKYQADAVLVLTNINKIALTESHLNEA